MAPLSKMDGDGDACARSREASSDPAELLHPIGVVHVLLHDGRSVAPSPLSSPMMRISPMGNPFARPLFAEIFVREGTDGIGHGPEMNLALRMILDMSPLSLSARARPSRDEVLLALDHELEVAVGARDVEGRDRRDCPSSCPRGTFLPWRVEVDVMGLFQPASRTDLKDQAPLKPTPQFLPCSRTAGSLFRASFHLSHHS